MENGKLGQVASYALSTGVAWFVPNAVLAFEFRGGVVFGGLLRLHVIGMYIFLSALLMTLLYRRIAAAEALVASVCCLPLYFYLTAPGPARRIFGDHYSAPLQASFAWNGWAVLGILSLVIAASVSVWTLAPGKARAVARGRV